MNDVPFPFWQPDLPRRLRENDHAAFEIVVRREYARVYRQLWCLTGGDEAVSSDLTQETFVAAWESLAQFNAGSSIGTWLHTIAVRVWFRALRQKTRRVPQTPLADALAELIPATDTPDPVQVVASAASVAALQVAVNGLPPAYRRAVVLFYTDELRYREIAVRENIAEGTVKSRLSVAIRLLRDRLLHRKEELL